MTWHYETLHDYVREGIRIDAMIYEGRTEFQEVRIFHNEFLGRVMTLDGVVQTTEADEFIYHEMLAHLPILAHGAIQRVLLIGGGDGGCIEEVLKHPVERLVMVELDGQIVELSKRHLPDISKGAFEDPRLELIIADGAKFVAESHEAFDLIIVDSTDPIGPGIVLFEEAFYAGCHQRLGASGILITQNGVPFFQRESFDQTGATRADLFRHSGYYFATVPTYFGGAMAFGWASDGSNLAEVDVPGIEKRYRAWNGASLYYNPAVHSGAFATPNYLAVGGPNVRTKA